MHNERNGIYYQKVKYPYNIILLVAVILTGVGFRPIQANAEATAEFENGQYLYFGRYTGEQLKWRVMEVDETYKTAILVLIDVLKDNLGNIPSISNNPTATDWQNSLVCTLLNGVDFLNGFYMAEQNFNELENEGIGYFVFASASRYLITTKIIKGSKVRANLDIKATADGHSLVPCFKDNGVESIVALSAVIDDLMCFTAPWTAEYDYKENGRSFNDTMNHWAKDEISFVTARNLFSEIRSGVFAPDTPTSRGMFVAALGRLLNIDISSFKALRFNDVKGEDYYAPYVEWAAESGIVIGIGEDLFAPDKGITREEMAAIVDRYAKFAGFELKAINGNTAPFIDEIQIGAWAKDAVKIRQKTGILSGKPGNLFDPKGTAIRAETSTILRRIIISIVN